MGNFYPDMTPRGEGGSESQEVRIVGEGAGAPVAGVDVFGRLRVGAPFTLADLVMRYEIDTRDWGQSTATGGAITYLPNEQAARLAVTGTSGSQSILQTNAYFRYQAGKAQWIRMTLYHADTGKTNQVREWGYFDANNGLFFRLSGTTLSVVRRTFTSGAAVDNVVAQSSWNVDKLDGTGTSGATIDVTKTQIYEIEFQHLAVGNIYFRVNGVLVHLIRNANFLSVPYMTSANLPVRFQVTNAAASTASSMTAICTSVEVNGGVPAPEESFGCINPADITISTTERPLLAIRPKTTYASATNRMAIFPKHASIWGRNNNDFQYRLILNPTTLTAGGAAPTWTSADTRGGVEFSVNADAFTGGQTLLGGVVVGTAMQIEELGDIFTQAARRLQISAFGTTADTFVIVAQRIGAGDAAVRGSIHWGETR